VLRLHHEILDYAKYTKSIVAEMAVHIEKSIEKVRSCVRKLWPKAVVETYGSYSTGIWLPSSDIDLVILVRVLMITVWFFSYRLSIDVYSYVLEYVRFQKFTG
jgi:tRNA nucleotidyltransferase (CCA-adding enzyme)